MRMFQAVMTFTEPVGGPSADLNLQYLIPSHPLFELAFDSSRAPDLSELCFSTYDPPDCRWKRISVLSRLYSVFALHPLPTTLRFVRPLIHSSVTVRNEVLE